MQFSKNMSFAVVKPIVLQCGALPRDHEETDEPPKRRNDAPRQGKEGEGKAQEAQLKAIGVSWEDTKATPTKPFRLSFIAALVEGLTLARLCSNRFGNSCHCEAGDGQLRAAHETRFIVLANG